MRRSRRLHVAAALVVLGAAACQPPADVAAPPSGPRPTMAPSHSPTQTARPPLPSPTPAAGSPAPESPARPRPAWLGTRVLPLRPDGFGEVQPTPRVLRNRRLETVDELPPPPGEEFTWSIDEVPADVVRRSTWASDCPVELADLRYATVAFWGFDEQPHTGELLLHAEVAEDVVGVFRQLHRERFPIEEMRVVRAEELDLPPTGDGNNTTSFVCRPSRGTTTWSQHAYGQAVDINPFHNPYVKRDLVLPELASAYADRDRRRPGMVLPGGPVVAAFADIGWGWGGHWSSLKDWMHFSASGT